MSRRIKEINGREVGGKGEGRTGEDLGPCMTGKKKEKRTELSSNICNTQNLITFT